MFLCNSDQHFFSKKRLFITTNLLNQNFVIEFLGLHGHIHINYISYFGIWKKYVTLKNAKLKQ